MDSVGGDGKPSKGEVIYSDDEDEDEVNEDGLTEEQVSKKKQRKLAVRPTPPCPELARDVDGQAHTFHQRVPY